VGTGWGTHWEKPKSNTPIPTPKETKLDLLGACSNSYLVKQNFYSQLCSSPRLMAGAWIVGTKFCWNFLYRKNPGVMACLMIWIESFLESIGCKIVTDFEDGLSV